MGCTLRSETVFPIVGFLCAATASLVMFAVLLGTILRDQRRDIDELQMDVLKLKARQQ